MIIPYFIHHRGCPHRCLFCDQHAVAGRGRGGTADIAGELERTVARWLGRSRRSGPVQLAFFGGSFTCLDQMLQDDFLRAAQPCIERGTVDSLRVSTRPDCVTDEGLRFLRSRMVRTVELGAQSMDDAVLDRSRRGHSSRDTMRAIRLLKRGRFEVGVQLMVGLPGETTRSFLAGVRRLVALNPDFVRLYPALVLDHTGLAELFRKGTYRPLNLARAVVLCGKARNLFSAGGVRVIRTGLQPSAGLAERLLAGPYHPSFGELVLTRNWYIRVRRLLVASGAGTTVRLAVSDRDYSALVGPRGGSMERLRRLPLAAELVVSTDPGMERGSLRYAVD